MGLGTFRPVKVEDVENIDGCEYYALDKANASIIQVMNKSVGL